MTRAQSNNDIESRLTRLESLLMNTATLSNRSATDFDQMLAAFDPVRERKIEQCGGGHSEKCSRH
jgi:hypothetical protein